MYYKTVARPLSPFRKNVSLMRIMSKIMMLNEHSGLTAIHCCKHLRLSLFIASSAIISAALNRYNPPSRFPESITRRSYNVFVVCVAGDIVATATNKAQTDGWTDRRMDRRGRRCIFRLLPRWSTLHELAKAGARE